MLYDRKRWEPKPVVLEPWRQVLLNAADLLKREGWTRGAYHYKGTQHCAIGAINRGGEGILDRWRAKKALRGVLGGYGIMHWNDHLANDKQEVISMMKWAAKS